LYCIAVPEFIIDHFICILATLRGLYEISLFLTFFSLLTSRYFHARSVTDTYNLCSYFKGRDHFLHPCNLIQITNQIITFKRDQNGS
jgi:hypothetical protein